MISRFVVRTIVPTLTAWLILCPAATLAEPVAQTILPTLSFHSDTSSVSKQIPASARRGCIDVRVTWIGALPAPWEKQDEFILSLKSVQPKINIKYHFRSAYQRYRMDFIDLTGDGMEEIVLVSGVGRGTSVTKEYLTVLQIEKKGLKPLGKTPLSGYFAEGSRWWYEIAYVQSSTSACPEVQLSLTHDEMPERSWGGPEFIPKEESKTLSFCSGSSSGKVR